MYDPQPQPSPQPPAPAQLSIGDWGDIQGNILVGFNKDHQMFLFVEFADADVNLTRGWLGKVVPRIATTTQVAAFNQQFSEARKHRGGDDPENLKALWINLGLTSSGLQKLSPVVESDLTSFTAFRNGPASRAVQLSDLELSDPSRWVLGRPDRPAVDAILTIAADDEKDLQVELDKQRTLLATFGIATLFEQRGETLPGPRRGHEHFGFKDGISQPGVRGFDPPSPDNPNEVRDKPGTDLIAAGEFVLGFARQPDVTGNADVHPHPDWMRNGSFQVFRRLNQDVPGFWALVTRAVESPSFTEPPGKDMLAAKLVGRWRSGTPLERAPVRDNRSAQEPKHDNDFTYDADLEGFITPRFAHIRKMYPRLEAGPEVFPERERHRIIRRGIPFGPAFDPAGGRGHGVDADRSLCFNVFMASIEEGFEFLQEQWANNPDFFTAGDGPDPIIGTSSSPCTFRREGLVDQSLPVERFVTTTGAVYAFAPSLSTLGKLMEGAL